LKAFGLDPFPLARAVSLLKLASGNILGIPVKTLCRERHHKESSPTVVGEA
jgi:hypothetical protein